MPDRYIATRIVNLEDDTRDVERISLAVASALAVLSERLGPYRLESQTMTTIYRQAGPQLVVCCVGLSLSGEDGHGAKTAPPAPGAAPAWRPGLPGMVPLKN